MNVQMLTIEDGSHKALFALLAAISMTAAVPAFSEMILRPEQRNSEQSFGLNPQKPGLSGMAKRDASPELWRAVERGSWTRACGLATSVLAQNEPNLDALGLFAICQALIARTEETAQALSRLSNVEPSPAYYAPLTEAIVHLRNGRVDKAEADLDQVLKSRRDDPLATYFRGELLHAQRKDGDAIATFNAVLKTWPEFAPALSAAARLMADKGASTQTLDAAIAMCQRAALIEPMNLAYWKQTADLYDRAGQHERAEAIRLQWLNRPTRAVGGK